MPISHRQKLTWLWLLLSALLAVFLFYTSQTSIEDTVKERLREHLLLTLDEANFGTAEKRTNDQKALQRIGEQINTAMQDMVINRWYAAQNNCVVRLQRIDDVTIDDDPARRVLSISILRNQIERQVDIGLSCSPNWLGALGIVACLGLLFAGINFSLPPPLTKVHRQWINYLLERGYSGAAAFAIIRQYDAPRLDLSPTQLKCLEQLHDREKQNFPGVLETVTTAGVAALDEAQVDWFLLGLQGDQGNLSRALSLVAVEESVKIDLRELKLSIRGLHVPMSGTPLFYYAWYAMRRVSGDGWITNPASNRPDPVLGQELIELMSRFDGHAKAINDLERTGLKAKTLDQNRSKIKDDLVATLGKKLANAYLFEASKHQNGVQMRYRLQLDAQHIQIIT